MSSNNISENCLKGKYAVVTGSAQGIGLSIAKELLNCGASVCICDINEELCEKTASNLSAEFPEKVIFKKADVSSIPDLQEMFKFINEEFGGLDILVNNAGILYSNKIEDITVDEWDRVMKINLGGTFFASQQALPYLKKSKSPRIINISSIGGRMGSYESGMSYVASKGGINSLTYGMSRHLAPYGITVNAVCPGTIETEMINAWSDEQRQNLLSKIPLGYLGKPEDIAYAVSFLASEKSKFITGLMLDVNGGMYVG